MMKRWFTNEDFEDFLKTNSNRFQMRPSEKVWQAISADLNRKRRRIAWFTSVFILAISGITYYLSLNSTGNIATQPAPQDKSFNTGNSQIKQDENISLPDEQNIPVAVVHTPASNEIRNRKSSPLYIAYKQEDIIREKVLPALASSSDNSTSALANNNNKTAFTGTIIDSYPEYIDVTVKENKASETSELPFSIESVTNIFKAGQRNKLNFELFFTPTISYRKLSENKTYMQTSGPATPSPGVAALYNVNDAVTHKPNVGLELGVTAKYPVTENIRVKGGVQFNMSRYDIKAFTNYSEVATMAFRDGNTRMSATNYRNLGGEKPNWLQNVYFQVSAPVGMELKLGRTAKTQFGIASTVQPTYMIGDRAYIISTDYKNYVKVPWLVRRWNVNTALETFVTYSTGKMHWQVGPQVRYQVLSSFISNYPVKENLFDFGLKIGITLNKSNPSSGQKE
jgi:hypothetical protein